MTHRNFNFKIGNKMRMPLSRIGEVRRLQHRIERDGFPRLQMTFLVMLTGGSGFLASFALFHAGLHSMSIRYLLACFIAYIVFLLLLWLWLRTKAEDYADIPDVGNTMPSSSGNAGEGVIYSGNGGDFGGGGASGSFDGASSNGIAEPLDSGGVGDALEGVAAAEELAIPLIVIVALVALLLSSLYVVYTAPVLFAELMLDGMLSAGLYHRLKGIEKSHWFETALRKTFIPFVLTALMFFVAGWLMNINAPEAHTIGAFLQHH
jgi:hypothetical protein